MASQIRVIRHEVVPQTGSYEVRFAAGRESRFFYWDDIPGRRLRPDMLTSEAGSGAGQGAGAGGAG